ncbi:hypothetical protein HanOQP8_Chr12g0447501 [Helianthus annuus]|nr:hypothetical protein HanOQP8_Chr12g0447501 [Helianthus annuus]
MCSFLIWLSSVMIIFFVHSLAIATRMHARSIPKNRATLALGKRIRWNHYLFTRAYDKDASKFSRRKALTNFEPSSCDGKLSPGTENEG